MTWVISPRFLSCSVHTTLCSRCWWDKDDSIRPARPRSAPATPGSCSFLSLGLPHPHHVPGLLRVAQRAGACARKTVLLPPATSAWQCPGHLVSLLQKPLDVTAEGPASGSRVRSAPEASSHHCFHFLLPLCYISPSINKHILMDTVERDEQYILEPSITAFWKPPSSCFNGSRYLLPLWARKPVGTSQPASPSRGSAGPE